MTPEALAYCEKQAQRIATLEQQNAELVAALRDWDGLMEYNYSGSREAMSAMQQCAFNTKDILDIEKLAALEWAGKCQHAERELTAAQAREAKLRSALLSLRGPFGWGKGSPQEEAIALPS